MVLQVVFSVTHHHILPIQFPSQHDSYAGLIEEFKANPRRESKWQNYCNTKSEQPKNPHESPPQPKKNYHRTKAHFGFWFPYATLCIWLKGNPRSAGNQIR